MINYENLILDMVSYQAPGLIVFLLLAMILDYLYRMLFTKGA